MTATAPAMRVPTQDDLRSLLHWQSPGGVVSVYLDLHPEDRDRWRIELRNGLAAARARSDGAEPAFTATARRIEQRIEDEQDGSGRTRIAFAEVAAKRGREEWFALQASLPEPEITLARRPALAPLAATLDRNSPRGVALVSGERVRLLIASLAGLQELADWGLEIFSLDWRERKAKRSSDPARVQGVSASGHDQYDQRLDANRERFLHEAGRLAASELRGSGCAELLVFGDPAHARALAESAGPDLSVRGLEPHNLISAGLDEVAERLNEHTERLQRERESRLLKRVEAEAGMENRAALGAEVTRKALAEGRVEHLLFEAHAADVEELVETALETSARVTEVRSDDGVQALNDAGGVAALLRY